MNSTYDDLEKIVKTMEGLDAVVFNGGLWHMKLKYEENHWHSITIGLQAFVSRILQIRKDLGVWSI